MLSVTNISTLKFNKLKENEKYDTKKVFQNN